MSEALPLQPTFSVLYITRFNIKNIAFRPHSVFICSLDTEIKYELFPYTAMTSWIL
jgi:hypothetical protein